MSAHADLMQGMNTNQQSLWVPFIIAFVAHIAVFILFVGMPHWGPQRNTSSRIINVRMVSLPSPRVAPSPQTAPEKSVDKKTPPPKKTAIVKPKPKPAPKSEAQKKVSVAPKQKKKKRSLKKKTFKREKVVKSALERVEKRVEKSRPDPIKEALNRIKESVDKGERKNPAAVPSTDNGAHGTQDIPGYGKPTLDLLDIYQAEIPYYIQKNWAFSEQLAGGQADLLAVLVIKIMRNGEIKDIWFEQRSGNRYLDESAYKAIQKSTPLPPLPKGITRSFIQVGLRFTPSGLN